MTSPSFFFKGNPPDGLAGFFAVSGLAYQVIWTPGTDLSFEGIPGAVIKALSRGFRSTAGWNACTESEFLAFCRVLPAWQPHMEESILKADERQIEIFAETSIPSNTTSVAQPWAYRGHIIW